MSASPVASEAVLFYGNAGEGVLKSMLYADFDSIVDHMVGIPEYAGQTMKGAYCAVDGQLNVVAAVLFLLEFNEDGMADPAWNIPLRHLAEHASQGPDLGAGPIRLACRSQCPVAWHQDQLWDPVMKPGANDFVFMRDTIRERGRRLGLLVEDAPAAAEVAPAPAASSAAASADEVPTLEPADDVPTVEPEPEPEAEPGDEERKRLARMIKELRLRIQTMQKKHKDEIDQLQYARQQKEQILNTQLEKVLMQFKTLKSQNRALREESESLREQVNSLNESLEAQARGSEEHGHEIEVLTEQYRVALEQRLEEERAHLNEQLHAKDMDIHKRDERIAELEQELEDARREQTKMANTGAEKLLEKLQGLGLNFIAYHPGAGHISINANEISDYMQNPTAFAARKCMVTEEHYRAWLEHFENPVCNVEVGNGQICGKRVIRVDEPNQFQPGVSDRNQNRCQNCREDSAIDNVLKFR
jgi:hypothetical protein